MSQELTIFYGNNKTANLIDIELVYIQNKDISRRLLVEGGQLTETLCSTIRDILEIFPKLSGLNNLKVTKLQKKEGEELKMNVPIEKQINQKDIIYFDLEFGEVWVDVIMTVKDGDDETKRNKFKFELRTESNPKNIKDLETILVYCGIGIWERLKEKDDYYLSPRIH